MYRLYGMYFNSLKQIRMKLDINDAVLAAPGAWTKLRSA